MPKKFKKCSKKAFCSSLVKRLQEPNARKKGLVPIQVMNMKTTEMSIIGVAYKMDARDKGVMINYCPWCGEKVLFEDEFKQE